VQEILRQACVGANSFELLPTQGIQDRTVRRSSAARAPSNQSRETVAYPLKCKDALVDVGELRLRGALDAGNIALRRDRQQITHLPQAKSQRLRAA